MAIVPASQKLASLQPEDGACIRVASDGRWTTTSHPFLHLVFEWFGVRMGDNGSIWKLVRYFHSFRLCFIFFSSCTAVDCMYISSSVMTELDGSLEKQSRQIVMVMTSVDILIKSERFYDFHASAAGIIVENSVETFQRCRCKSRNKCGDSAVIYLANFHCTMVWEMYISDGWAFISPTQLVAPAVLCAAEPNSCSEMSGDRAASAPLSMAINFIMVNRKLFWRSSNTFSVYRS